MRPGGHRNRDLRRVRRGDSVTSGCPRCPRFARCAPTRSSPRVSPQGTSSQPPGAEQWDRVPGRDAEQYCAIRGLGGRAGRRAKCTAYCHAVGIICCCFQRGGGDVSDPALLLPAAPTVASARRARQREQQRRLSLSSRRHPGAPVCRSLQVRPTLAPALAAPLPRHACTERSERSEQSPSPWLPACERGERSELRSRAGCLGVLPQPPTRHSHALALRLPVARVRVARSVHDPCMSA